MVVHLRLPAGVRQPRLEMLVEVGGGAELEGRLVPEHHPCPGACCHLVVLRGRRH